MNIRDNQLLKFIQLFWILVSTVRADSSTSCWAKDGSQEPVVGFNIGLIHGTVTVAFPNGSFLDLVRLEAGPAYQARVLNKLRDEGCVQVDQSLQGDEDSPSVKDHDSGQSRWRRALLSRQAPLGIGTHKSAADNTSSKTCDIRPAQSDLEALILEMKTKTEEYLEKPINHLTVTTPSFFTPTDKSDLKLALGKLSLHVSSCGDIEDSAIAATIATRFSQFSPKRDENMTSAECILGPFGVEEVVVVDYTEDVLALSIFQLNTGKQTWSEDRPDRKEHFVAIRNSSNTISELRSDTEETSFWDDIKTGIRQTALRHTVIHDRTLRLVLQGPPSLNPKILSTLHSALGALLPSPSQPRAIRMILTQQELRAKEQKRRDREKAFTCVLTDQEGEWRVKDYERDLLRAIYDANDGWIDVTEGFVGSRGAALMGLHSLGLPCEERQVALERPWVWDNERSSSLWYPEELEP